MAVSNSTIRMFLILWCLIILTGQVTDTPAEQLSNGPICSMATEPQLCLMVENGALDNLRWPDFSDVRPDARTFYQSSNYSLAWTKETRPTPQALGLVQALERATEKGLYAEDYDGLLWSDRLTRLLATATPSYSDLAYFDLSLTISVMRYVSALHNGRVNPRHLNIDIDVECKKYKLAEFVRERLMEADDVATTLQQIEPSYAGYWRTLAALKTYLDLSNAGEGDPLTKVSKPLKPGDHYAGMLQLAKRLQIFGDLRQEELPKATDNTYEGPVVAAVRLFQQRHGLAATGTLDATTFNELTIPLSQRVSQLQLTLERWRWLPSDLPDRLIVVNVPEFQLRGYQNHIPTIAMRVVVGKTFPERQTPIFQDEMQYLIFRPYWNVPLSITRKELVPEFRKNPEYLAKHDFQVVNTHGEVVTENVSDSGVLVQLKSGGLEVRQKPGPRNSLGLIKFVFPNDYSVYLHGTPEHALFSHAQRAFSHGCIRIEDPESLAAWVLQDDPSWSPDRIRLAMDGRVSLRVNLPRPLTVLVLYGTAVVEEDGKVHFLNDIYGLDVKLAQALAKGYPYPL